MLAGKTIVTVEDEGVTQLQLKRCLTRASLHVVGQAMNGAEGVEMVLRERPDLVLMDVNMPIMDGIEATRQIVAEWDGCLIMLTAYSDEQTQADAQEAGAQGYVLKPLVASEMLETLERVYAAHCGPK